MENAGISESEKCKVHSAEFKAKLGMATGSFYLTAVDEQIKHPQDHPTIGLLLCRSKNKVVAEYALRTNAQPLGVVEYKLLESLPAELQTSLPSIEQIERELAGSPSHPDEDDA